MYFAEKYGAVAFDENSENDAVAEAARLAVVEAYKSVIEQGFERAPRENEFVLAGLLVGLVQVAKTMVESSDKADAAIRSSICQTAPWAVDMARAMQGLPPLSDGN